jgi:NADPH:quinone reductase
MMKALQATIVDGTHKLALKDVPKPSIEKPNQILVKVIAAAVNPSDIMNSKGTRTPQSPFPTLPWVALAGRKLII